MEFLYFSSLGWPTRIFNWWKVFSNFMLRCLFFLLTDKQKTSLVIKRLKSEFSSHQIKILRNAGTKVFKSKNSFQNNNQKSVFYDLKKYFLTSSASTCSPSTRPCSSSFASLPSSAPLGFFFFINLHIVNNTDNVNKQLFSVAKCKQTADLPVNAPTNSCKDSNKDDGNNGDDHPWFHASFIDHKIHSFFFCVFDFFTNIFESFDNNILSLKL